MPPPMHGMAPPGMASASGVGGAAAAPPPLMPSNGQHSGGPSKDARPPEDPAEREKRRKEREARHAAEAQAQKEKQKKEKELKRKREEEEKQRQKRLEWIPASSTGIGQRLHQRGEFLAPYSFSNALPEVPSDPKLLTVSFNKEAFVRYRYDSSTEAAQKYELLAEPDLGIPIDLVDPQAYDAPQDATVEPADAELLSDVAMAQATGARGASAGRVKQQMRAEVTWLRKTPIMGNNLYEAVHKQQKQNTERQHVVSASRELATVPQGKRTLEEQVDAIEKSFDEAAALDMRDGKSDAKHPTRPELTPVSVLPVLPDFECWCNNYVLMAFDADPAQDVPGGAEAARARCADALIKGFNTSEQVGGSEVKNSFLAYMLPKPRPTEAAEAEPDDAQELEWIREYQFETRPKDKDATGYFLNVHEDAVVYNEYATKMSLTRKIVSNVHKIKPSRISLSRRALEEEEVAERAQQKEREKGFLLPAPQAVLALTHKE